MTNAQKRSLNIAALFTLVAIAVHAYLAKQHYMLKFGAGGGPSVCNINAVFNCDAVAASSYSVLLGIPVAIWGAMANAVLLLMILIASLGWSDRPERAARYSLMLVSLIALASLGMGAVSLLYMHTYCVFCITAYVLSFLAFFFVWRGAGGFQNVGDDIKALFVENKGMGVLFIMIPLGALFANASTMSMYGSSSAKINAMAVEKVNQWKAAPEQKFDEARGLVLQGKDQPRMTIVEFADFLCPHCKHASPTLDAFTRAHSDVKLIFKAFPLDGTCNPDPNMGGGGDGVRCQISNFVMCAEKVAQKGWEAHHYFFENQEGLAFQTTKMDDAAADFCKEVNVDCAPIKACAESTETKDTVRAMAQEGIDAQIRGTPTIFVNGRQLGAGQLLPVLEEAYRNLGK